MATAAEAGGEARTVVDDDPVVARYNVFLKPPLAAHQKLLLLQYPNRIPGLIAALAESGVSPPPSTPTELRIKSASGMVEVDVPIDTHGGYDRAKGMAWGAALASSTKAKAGGSHGLAGGFGVGGQQGHQGGRGGGGGVARPAVAPAPDMGAPMDWSEAVRQDRVLRLQTLGGMCPPTRSAEARWMIGVFDGGNLHLTPVSSLVHLRPQMHHIDAETEVERQKHRDSTGLGGAGAGAGGGGARGGPGGGPAARAIHMTIKSAGADGDEMVTETMADRLRAVQMEPWTRMEYVGDDDERSWDVYDQTLFLRPKATEAAPGAEEKEDTGKGKGKAVDEAAEPGLAEKVPLLKTGWTEDDMLQAISGMPKPSGEAEAETKPVLKKVTAQKKGKGKEKTVTIAEPEIKAEPEDATAAGRRTRPGRPAASTRGRGGARPRGGRGAAMEVD